MRVFKVIASSIVAVPLVVCRPSVNQQPMSLGASKQDQTSTSSGMILSDANGFGEVNLTTYFKDLPMNKTFRVDFETWSGDAWTWEALAHAPESGNGTRAFKEGKSVKTEKGAVATLDFVAKDNWIFFDITVKTKNASAAVYASQFSPFQVE